MLISRAKNYSLHLTYQVHSFSLIIVIIIFFIIYGTVLYIEPVGVPFVDLKTFPGYLELKRENDAHSDPIIIPRGLLFGRTRVTSAYVI